LFNPNGRRQPSGTPTNYQDIKCHDVARRVGWGRKKSFGILLLRSKAPGGRCCGGGCSTNPATSTLASSKDPLLRVPPRCGSYVSQRRGPSQGRGRSKLQRYSHAGLYEYNDPFASTHKPHPQTRRVDLCQKIFCRGCRPRNVACRISLALRKNVRCTYLLPSLYKPAQQIPDSHSHDGIDDSGSPVINSNDPKHQTYELYVPVLLPTFFRSNDRRHRKIACQSDGCSQFCNQQRIIRPLINWSVFSSCWWYSPAHHLAENCGERGRHNSFICLDFELILCRLLITQTAGVLPSPRR
jgi:hypothetical protein